MDMDRGRLGSGHEESGGDLPEEEAEKFNYFFNAHPPGENTTLCDIRELYRHVAARLDGPRADLFTTFYEYRFGTNAIQKLLCKRCSLRQNSK